MQEKHTALPCVMDFSTFPAVFASFLPERRHMNRIVTLSPDSRGGRGVRGIKKFGLLA
jgi:hypothetical protein